MVQEPGSKGPNADVQTALITFPTVNIGHARRIGMASQSGLADQLLGRWSGKN